MTKLIGYSCSYIPVELLSLTGYRPYHLLHGDIRLSKKGENLVRVDACPLVKSNLGFIFENRKDFVALVGSTGCDMARRFFDVASEIIDLPVFLFNNPRTDNPKVFGDEIDWLVKELEHLSNKKFDKNIIASEIGKWEDIRESLRKLDQKRKANPSPVSTTGFHKVLISYHQGDIDAVPKLLSSPPPSCVTGGGKIARRSKVYLIGSPISYEANSILKLLENKLRIIGDFNCGVSRFLNIKINERNINGLKTAYYNQPPCIFKRPNRLFYDWVDKQTRELNCSGIIAWILGYCDNYEFELKKMEERFGLPILKISSDFSLKNLNQLKTRIEAFAEILGVSS